MLRARERDRSGARKGFAAVDPQLSSGRAVAYVERTNPLWQLLADVASDEGLILYDVERKGPVSLRVTVAKGRDAGTVPADGVPADGVPADAAADAWEAPAADDQRADRAGDREAVVAVDERSARGVTSGDCSRLCRRLMVVFRAEGRRYGVGEEPEIDVSSPGINRELRLPQHFAGAVGERVKIVFSEEALSGHRSPVLFGTLRTFNPETADGGEIVVEDEQSGELVSLSCHDVKRANVDYKF